MSKILNADFLPLLLDMIPVFYAAVTFEVCVSSETDVVCRRSSEVALSDAKIWQSPSAIIFLNVPQEKMVNYYPK
jgi:hypothetical protein